MVNKDFLFLSILSFVLMGFDSRPVAKNMYVPPKEEWKICDTNDECTTKELDCVNAGPDVAYNKKFTKEYYAYASKKCSERVKDGEKEIMALRTGPPPETVCINQKCEIAPEKPPEEEPSYFQRFLDWLRDLF